MVKICICYFFNNIFLDVLCILLGPFILVCTIHVPLLLIVAFSFNACSFCLAYILFFYSTFWHRYLQSISVLKYIERLL